MVMRLDEALGFLEQLRVGLDRGAREIALAKHHAIRGLFEAHGAPEVALVRAEGRRGLPAQANLAHGCRTAADFECVQVREQHELLGHLALDRKPIDQHVVRDKRGMRGVALDADTGGYIWHYQTSPGETWDYNSAMDIELADLDIAGRRRPVLLHAPKNGFFYVLDRETGRPISAGATTPPAATTAPSLLPRANPAAGLQL